jgi:FkbM family methyltransferase
MFEINSIMDLKNKQIIVYGCGKIAKGMISYFKYLGFNIIGIAVTEMNNNPHIFWGLDVLKIEEYRDCKEDAFVYIAMNQKNAQGVAEKCRLLGYKNIIQFSQAHESELSFSGMKKMFDELNIDYSHSFLDFGRFKTINPLRKISAESSAMVNEIGDFIIPISHNEYRLISEGPYFCDNVRIKKKDVVIDAGANAGLFTVLAHSYDAVCYSFEPDKNLHSLIEENAALNGYNAAIVPCAISDQTCERTFYINDTNSGANSLYLRDINVHEERVNCITIDDFVIKGKLTKLDFIKADIEGAERDLLKGAVQTLKEYAPKLSLCTYHLPDDKEVLTDLIMKANPNYKIIYGWLKLFAYCE